MRNCYFKFSFIIQKEKVLKAQLACFTLISVTPCELCSNVRASRDSKLASEGSRLQISCEVRHCGVPGWTGGWAFQEMQSTGFTLLTPSERIELTNYSSTANSTHLLLEIHNINQSDAGAYKCMISWPNRVTSNGHVTYVNVTAGIAHKCILKFAYSILQKIK